MTTRQPSTGPFDVILFDLGGVLIDLPPFSTMMPGCPYEEEEIRRRWGTSPAVRSFETGLIDASSFANRMVKEFSIDSSPESFLTRFLDWPGQVFGGTETLLTTLRERFNVALLSNTNSVHWSRFRQETNLEDWFDTRFLSFELGLLKPDIDIYHHVIGELGTSPGQILFIDDSPANVAAASELGIDARLARGAEAVARTLETAGVVR